MTKKKAVFDTLLLTSRMAQKTLLSLGIRKALKNEGTIVIGCYFSTKLPICDKKKKSPDKWPSVTPNPQHPQPISAVW